MKKTNIKALFLALLYIILATVIILLEGRNPALQKVFIFITGVYFVITLKWLSNNIKDLPRVASKSKREITLVNMLIYFTAFLMIIGLIISFVR